MANTFENRVVWLRWLALGMVFFIVVHASLKIIKSPLSKGDFEAFLTPPI
ncbi:MAG: hypothetical protein LH614_21325 [Pyrinomonadaceae bacterium]|nr:hypothetical protein [Pyrinomonadaceae bacterium]